VFVLATRYEICIVSHIASMCGRNISATVAVFCVNEVIYCPLLIMKHFVVGGFLYFCTFTRKEDLVSTLYFVV
jgi:hypothetical protein